MTSKVKFATMAYSKYEADQTLPAKFKRILQSSDLGKRAYGKVVAIKIHVGDNLGYSTIPPVFLRTLTDYLRDFEADCFFTDHYLQKRKPEQRGYTENNIGAPVLEACAHTGKYFYTKEVNYNSFKHVDIAGLIYDADFLIDFSHFKGHGNCGYGGACKNLAMGAVTDRTRREIHDLGGGLNWDAEKCIHCGACISACNHYANKFDNKGFYKIKMHHCTNCQHCAKVCPNHAISINGGKYKEFQMGMALCTKEIINCFEPGNIFYINLLTAITAVCDCWGITTPSLVPDIGIMASNDIVAIDQASLDAVKVENLIQQGIPEGHILTGKGHIFEQLHGKDPYLQIELLEQQGLGTRNYEFEMID